MGAPEVSVDGLSAHAPAGLLVPEKRVQDTGHEGGREDWEGGGGRI